VKENRNTVCFDVSKFWHFTLPVTYFATGNRYAQRAVTLNMSRCLTMFTVLSMIRCVLTTKEVLFTCRGSGESGKRGPAGSPGRGGHVGPPVPQDPPDWKVNRGLN